MPLSSPENGNVEKVPATVTAQLNLPFQASDLNLLHLLPKEKIHQFEWYLLHQSQHQGFVSSWRAHPQHSSVHTSASESPPGGIQVLEVMGQLLPTGEEQTHKHSLSLVSK